MTTFAPRFPRNAAITTVLGIIMIGVVAVDYFMHGFPGNTSTGYLSSKAFILIGLGGIACLYMGGSIFAKSFLRHNPTLIFQDTHVMVDQNIINFSDIETVTENLENNTLTIVKRLDSTPLRLHTFVYGDDGALTQAFYGATFEKLFTEAEEKLQKGETIAFGKHVTLSNADIRIKKVQIPFDTIQNAYTYLEEDSGAVTKELQIIDKNNKKTKINTKDIPNLHILMAFLDASITS